MKKNLKRIFAILTLSCFLIPVTPKAVYASVNISGISCIDMNKAFPDENLRKAIYSSSSTLKDPGPNYTTLLSVDNFDNIQVLNISNCQISSFEGLQYLRNLNTINFNNVTISADLSSISCRTKIKSLSITNNSNISLLSKLNVFTNLTSLNLSGDNITSLSSIPNLSNLESLSLDNNKISNLTPLSNSKSLKSLSLNSNNISSLSVISNLKDLQSLCADNNEIYSLSPLSSSKSLKNLSLNSNNISDLSPLIDLSSLENINLASNKIYDLSPLYWLDNLQALSCDNQNVTLSSQTSLGSLKIKNPLFDIDGMPVTNIFNLSNNGSFDEDNNEITWNDLTKNGNLTFDFSTTVSIGDTSSNFSGRVNQNVEISKLDPAKNVNVYIPDKKLKLAILNKLNKSKTYKPTINDMESIKSLDLNNKGISSLTGLEYCINITSLLLNNNNISDLSPLSNLKNLSHLELSNNKISSIEPLCSLSELISLNLDNNYISDSSALSKLPKLKSLSIENQNI